MKELSLNILDIVQNSISAEASLIEILLAETDETLRITIKDDGRGMPPEPLYLHFDVNGLKYKFILSCENAFGSNKDCNKA